MMMELRLKATKDDLAPYMRKIELLEMEKTVKENSDPNQETKVI